MRQVSFTTMEEGTYEDYQLTKVEEDRMIADWPESVLGWLKQIDVPSVYQVSRYQHSLQAATRAHRAGEDEEMVVAALLHDVGDVLAPANHSEVTAAMLRPYISDRVYWIIKHHGLFQGYYYSHHYGEDRNIRDRFKDHEWYEDTVRFCADYDQVSFDPTFDPEPLEFFEPMVRRQLAEPKYAQ